MLGLLRREPFCVTMNFSFQRKSRRQLTRKEKGKKKLNYLESKQERIKFDVLLTSYEMVNLDTFILKLLHSFISLHPTHAN